MQSSFELPWNGVPFESKIISLDTETNLVDLKKEIPQLALATASDGDRTVILHPDQVEGFLFCHQNHEFVFHNVAFDFWVIYQYLVDYYKNGIPSSYYPLDGVWFDLANQNKFHDTMLLDMLVRLAQGKGESGAEEDESDFFPRDLGELTKEYFPSLVLTKSDPYRKRYGELLGLSLEQLVQADVGFFEYAYKDALATAKCYKALSMTARRLQEPFIEQGEVYSDSIEKYGLLTEQIQIKGAIALYQITRNGIAVSQEKAKCLEGQYRTVGEQHLVWLKNNHPDLFEYFKKTGLMKMNEKAQLPKMRHKYIKEQLTNFCTKNKIPIPLVGKKQEITVSWKYWLSFKDQDPFLQSWIGFASTNKLLSFFEIFHKNPDSVHASYGVLMKTGRTSCYDPNLQQIPRLKTYRDIFVARPGFKILTIDYAAIELVTLASTCLFKYGFSKLGDVIRNGIDPHANTAAMLNGISLPEFLSLKTTDPEKFKKDRQGAKVYNFGKAGGLGAKKLVVYAKNNYGVELTEEEATLFSQKVIREVYPELSDINGYLADTTPKILADNLKITEEMVVDHFKARFDNIGMAFYCLQKVLQDDPYRADGERYQETWIQQLWVAIESLMEKARAPWYLLQKVKNREASGFLCSKLMQGTAATLTGRLRGHVRYTAQRNTPFQGLAADGGKLALWELIRQGFRVVGFIHDEMLIEIPDSEIDLKVAEAKGIIENQMSGVLKGAVPVSTEYHIGDCWNK